eukprot:1983266-Pleurochrysis_carterae.AAC.1
MKASAELPAGAKRSDVRVKFRRRGQPSTRRGGACITPSPPPWHSTETHRRTRSIQRKLPPRQGMCSRTPAAHDGGSSQGRSSACAHVPKDVAYGGGALDRMAAAEPRRNKIAVSGCQPARLLATWLPSLPPIEPIPKLSNTSATHLPASVTIQPPSASMPPNHCTTKPSNHKQPDPEQPLCLA